MAGELLEKHGAPLAEIARDSRVATSAISTILHGRRASVRADGCGGRVDRTMPSGQSG